MEFNVAILKKYVGKKPPVPRLMVSRAIKSIFLDDPNKLTRSCRVKNPDGGLLQQMKGNSAPSFEESAIKNSPATKKVNTSNQSNSLDEKLNNFMLVLSKKASFEEPTIVNAPAPKSRNDPANGDDPVLDVDLGNFLKESMDTDAAPYDKRRKSDKRNIQWDPKVFDIYDPEFSSEDEATRPQTTIAAAKTVAHNFQKKPLHDERLDPHHIKSVYFDNQGSGQKSDNRRTTEDKFTIYSTKLSSKPGIPKQPAPIKNPNFVKKTSIYSSIRDEPGANPYLERDVSPKRQLTFHAREPISKASMDKLVPRRLGTVTSKPSSEQFKLGLTDSFGVSRMANRSITRNLEANKSSQGIPQTSLRLNTSKPRETHVYSKFILGAKKKELNFY
jgi:hypothetical protein